MHHFFNQQILKIKKIINCDLDTRVSRRLMQITALFSESNSPYNVSFPLFGRVD